MSIWTGIVVVTKIYRGVSVGSDTEEHATELLEALSESDLLKADPEPDAQYEVEDLECTEDCPDDEEEEG